MFDELHDPAPRRSTPADVAASLGRGDALRRRRRLVQGGMGAVVLVAGVTIGLQAVGGGHSSKVRIATAASTPGATDGSGDASGPVAGDAGGPAGEPGSIPGASPGGPGDQTAPSTVTPPARATPGPTATPTTNPATVSTIVAVTTTRPATTPPTVGRIRLTRADNNRSITVARGAVIEIDLGPDATSPEGSPDSIDSSVVKQLTETHHPDGSSTTVLSAVGPGHTQILGPWGGVPCDPGTPCPAIAVAHFSLTVDVA